VRLREGEDGVSTWTPDSTAPSMLCWALSLLICCILGQSPFQVCHNLLTQLRQ
jgi:hypothetical protein